MEEAAPILSMPVRSVWAAVRNGQLPAVRIGRRVRIAPTELERFIRAARDEEHDAEVRKHLAAGGRLERFSFFDLLFLTELTAAHYGLCEHLEPLSQPRYWSPARPDLLMCAACFADADSPRPCDYCHEGEALAWGEFTAVSSDEIVEFQGTALAVPRVTIRYRLCARCDSIRPEHFDAALANPVVANLAHKLFALRIAK